MKTSNLVMNEEAKINCEEGRIDIELKIIQVENYRRKTKNFYRDISNQYGVRLKRRMMNWKMCIDTMNTANTINIMKYY